MLGNLLESKPRRQRSVDGLVASVLAHGALIAAAGYAGGMITPPAVVERAPDRLIYMPPRPATPSHTAPAGARGTAGRGSGGPLLPPERTILIRIPSTNEPTSMGLEHLVAGPGTFEPSPVRGGDRGRGLSEGSDGVVSYAERPAVPRASNPKPDYPSVLRTAGVEGRVNARFTVDTTGHVEPGSIVLETESNELFAAAVRRALERARFTPAESGGRKVRIRMWQEFAFRITR